VTAKNDTGGYYNWKEGQAESLMTWWASLEKRRGERAQLRRCSEPHQILMEPGFYRLLNDYGPWPKYQIQGLAMLSGLLAHVKEHQKGKRLGQQLAQSKEGKDTPVMSELRFNQLQKSRQPEDMYRFLRRAILLLNGKVNVVSLAEFILAWDADYKYKHIHPGEPTQRLQFKFASDYYLKTKK
jgi:CRISPR system Cascade subunit CasB